MRVYITKSFRGDILGIYTNMGAARLHLEDLSVFRDQPHEWRNDHLYVNDRYAGRVEAAIVLEEYKSVFAR